MNISPAGVNAIDSDIANTVQYCIRSGANRMPRAIIIMTAFLAAALSTRAQVDVTTYQYNNQRTAVNSSEVILTPSNVNSTSFGRLFSQPVDGYLFAQPLYVPNVTINGAVHNVVYVATEHDSVYAFDADSNTGTNSQPLWHTSFLSTGVTTVPSGDLLSGNTDINPEVGITGTPVIDLSTGILYVAAETLENSGASFVKKLHALSMTTGAEMPNSPIVIAASVTVPGQSAVPFFTEGENQRPGLLLYNGVVYVGFAAHGDGTTATRGWILGYSYSASGFSQVFVYCSEPSSTNGWGGGIWMSGQGLQMDTGSNLFVPIGNGEFDTTITPPVDFGDSILRIDLSQGPTVQDYFTPSNQGTLADEDEDVGSGGIAVLPAQSGPNPDLLVQAGKQGTIYLVNRDNMGKYNAASDPVVQEVIFGVQGIFGAPVYFNGKVYFWGHSDTLKAFSVTNGALSTAPTDQGPDTFTFPGAVPTVSANGTSDGILWALKSSAFSNTGPGGPAVLYAYNASNLAAGSIYRSNQNVIRDNPGGAIKFAVPIITNGKVYVGAEGQFSVFGELASGLATPQINPETETTSGPITVTITATPGATISYTTDGSIPPGSSTSQTYNVPFNLTATSVVNAVAIQPGFMNSAIATATYTLGGPAITSLSTTSGPAGTPVTITGTNLGSSQGTSTVTFSGTAATVTTWSATSIATSVPAGATTGSVVVTVGGVASNGVNFTVGSGTGSTAPTITSANNTTFAVGSAGSFTLTSTGSPTPALTETGALPSGVTFADNGNGTGALGGTPAAGTGGTYSFTFTATNGVGTPASQPFTLTVDQAPAITSANSTTFAVGVAATFTVTTTGTPAPSLTESGALPSGVTFAANANGTGTLSGTPAAGTNGTYPLTFTASNGIGTAAQQNFILTVTQGPTIASLSVTAGTVGAPVTITGTNFGSTGTVTFNGTTATVTTWTATSIATSVPAGATTGSVIVTVGGVPSNGVLFTVTYNCGELGQTGTDSNNIDWGFASPCVTGSVANGFTAASVQYWVGRPVATQFDMGIYADASGSPGSLLCHTGTSTLTPVAGWNNISLLGKGCPTISANTRYWLGYITGSNTLQQGVITGSCPGTSLNAVYTNSQLGNAVLPEPFGATAGTPYCYSLYLVLNSTAGTPTITSLSTTSGPVGTPVAITGTNFGTSQGTSTVNFNGTATTVTNWTATSIATSVPAGATSGNVVVTVGGVASNGVNFTVSSTPSITSATTASGRVGTAFSYQITATNTPTSFGATGLPAGLSVSSTSGIISGTPAAAGTSTVTLSATNASGAGHATLMLTIAVAAPVITSATTANGTVGTAFSYQITATNTPTSFGATGLPGGLSVSSTSGLISGTPTAAGTSTVTLSATNGSGTGNATLTLTIALAAPVITSATTANGTVGTAFSYQITATNTPTSFGATGLPAGLSVSSTSGIISGTPTAAGTSTVTLSATNASGTGQATLTLTVSAAAPVITSATTASGTVGTAFSYQITATNTPTSFGATGLPAGLSVSSTSGIISGTPTAAGTSTVTLSATNASGTGHATLTLTIAVAAPVITSATTASGAVGTAFSYQITATNTPTSYGATGLPTGLSVNTTSGLISGTPTTAATSTVTLSATNSTGTGHATLTLTVTTGGAVSSAQTIAAQAPSSAASLSVSFLTNTVAGDLIMVAFDYDTNTVPSSVTDSQGNTFTQIGSQLTSPGATRSVVYYAKNIKGGADTVTVNLSGTSAWLELYLSEYAGANQTNPIDVQAGAAGSAGSVSSGNAITTAAGDIIYGYCVGDWACTTGAGFTTRSNFNNNLIEDEVAGAAGGYAATGSATNGWTMQMVAIKHN